MNLCLGRDAVAFRVLCFGVKDWKFGPKGVFLADSAKL